MRKHLDSEYRRKWEEYHMQDGFIYDSRNINWRDINNWIDIKEIKLFLKNKHYIINNNHPNFKHFVRFRSAGKETWYDKKLNKMIHKQIHEWCIGWTDGIKIYVEVFDFFTNNKIRDQEYSYEQCINHIHPSVKI